MEKFESLKSIGKSETNEVDSIESVNTDSVWEEYQEYCNHECRNLLVETNKFLKVHGKDPVDVLWVSTREQEAGESFRQAFDWKTFEELADYVYVKYVGTVDSSLQIVGDGWWLTRWLDERWGEGWEFNEVPTKPERFEAVPSVFSESEDYFKGLNEVEVGKVCEEEWDIKKRREKLSKMEAEAYRASLYGKDEIQLEGEAVMEGSEILDGLEIDSIEYEYLMLKNKKESVDGEIKDIEWSISLCKSKIQSQNEKVERMGKGKLDRKEFWMIIINSNQRALVKNEERLETLKVTSHQLSEDILNHETRLASADPESLKHAGYSAQETHTWLNYESTQNRELDEEEMLVELARTQATDGYETQED